MLGSGDEHGGTLKSEGGVGGDHNREKNREKQKKKQTSCIKMSKKNDSTFLKCFVALCSNIIPHENPKK